MKRFLCLIPGFLLFSAATAETDRVVNISPQSVEFFCPAEGNAPVLCTVRLHLTPADGYTIRQESTQQELTATDGAGNEMRGTFREWEICFDSDEGKRCIIAVYDFPTRPQGGSLSCDTSLSVPLSCGEIVHTPAEFTPAEACTISVNGHTFSVLPSAANAEDPDNTAFVLEYENAPDIAAICICDAEGTPLETNIVEGLSLEGSNKVSATYVVANGKHEKLGLRLTTHKPQGYAHAPVRFRATIGR